MIKFIKFIIKLLKFLLTLILILLLAFLVYAYVFTDNSNSFIQNTISHVKSIINNTDEFTLSSNDIVNNPTNNRYYYNQLDDTSKIIYASLENNIDNLKKDNYTINFSNTFNDLLHQSNGNYKLNKSFQSALDAFFYDHPELFYIDLTKISLTTKSISIGPLTNYIVSISPKDGKNYLYDNFYSEDIVDKAILKVESTRNNIISKVSNNNNNYKKALKVHDILVNSIKYDSTTKKDNSYNIYGALVENKVVCEGYAKAFKYILDSIGIDCILVHGTASNSSNKAESHMWNYIKLNNNWYGVDVTWDDPIIINAPNKNVLNHDYFCKGSKVFNKDHTINLKISDTGMLFSTPTLSSKNYSE